MQTLENKNGSPHLSRSCHHSTSEARNTQLLYDSFISQRSSHRHQLRGCPEVRRWFAGLVLVGVEWSGTRIVGPCQSWQWWQSGSVKQLYGWRRVSSFLCVLVLQCGLGYVFGNFYPETEVFRTPSPSHFSSHLVSYDISFPS